jgi:hypothetical protein
MRRFRFTSEAEPASAVPVPAPNSAEQFRAAKGKSWTTNNPWLRSAVRIVASVAPQGIPFALLANSLASALPPGVEPDEQRLAHALLQGVLSGLFEGHLFEPAMASTISDRPVASPLARVFAEKCHRAISRRHRMFDVSGLSKQLILALDGSRDRRALVEMLAERVRGGVPLLDEQNQPVHDPERIGPLLARGVDDMLRRFARNAILVA